MINEDIAQEILGQLFSSLEALQTQSSAILQFLKDKGIAGDQELAVHFEQAGKQAALDGVPRECASTICFLPQ